VEDLVLDYLSVGIDPEKCVLYLQSHVPEVAELFLILSMLVPVPRLQRIPTLKDTMQKSALSHPSLGLLAYPVLQAADILMVRAHLVPVGQDQTSHIEIARELARRFNSIYGSFFPIPNAWFGSHPLLRGLNGKAKMSKSLKNAIYLKDSPEDVRKKIFGMYTDPGRIHATDPGRIEGNPLFDYFESFAPNQQEVEEYKQAYQAGKIGDVPLKQRLAEIINACLDPIRSRRAYFEQHRSWIPEILDEGRRVVRTECQITLQSVKTYMKWHYPDMPPSGKHGMEFFRLE
jgi:tryptophanyl-tRNA synthetase